MKLLHPVGICRQDRQDKIGARLFIHENFSNPAQHSIKLRLEKKICLQAEAGGDSFPKQRSSNQEDLQSVSPTDKKTTNG
jgi:hypothetical protein